MTDFCTQREAGAERRQAAFDLLIYLIACAVQNGLCTVLYADAPVAIWSSE